MNSIKLKELASCQDLIFGIGPDGSIRTTFLSLLLTLYCRYIKVGCDIRTLYRLLLGQVCIKYETSLAGYINCLFSIPGFLKPGGAVKVQLIHRYVGVPYTYLHFYQEVQTSAHFLVYNNRVYSIDKYTLLGYSLNTKVSVLDRIVGEICQLNT